MNKFDMVTQTRLPRRTLFKGVGALGMGLALSQLDFLPSTGASVAAADTEQVQDILDILATNEAFGVTLVGTVLDSAKNGAYSPAIPAPILKILTGVRAEEQFHLDFLLAAGGKLRTQTFHIPDPVILAKPTDLFMDLVELEDAAVAAVIASLRTFAREGRIDLLKANMQFATEESEHRLLANRALGARPANDHAFAPALFTTVAEFYAALRQKGIIDGTSGKEINYPGAGAIDPDRRDLSDAGWLSGQLRRRVERAHCAKCAAADRRWRWRQLHPPPRRRIGNLTPPAPSPLRYSQRRGGANAGQVQGVSSVSCFSRLARLPHLYFPD